MKNKPRKPFGMVASAAPQRLSAQPDINEQLFQAAFYGHQAEADRLLDGGADPTRDQGRALHAAIDGRYEALAIRLLQRARFPEDVLQHTQAKAMNKGMFHLATLISYSRASPQEWQLR